MDPLDIRSSFDFDTLTEVDPALMNEAMLTGVEISELHQVVDSLLPTPEGQEDGSLGVGDARQLASMAFVAGRAFQLSKGVDTGLLLRLSPQTIQRFLDFLAQGDDL